MTKAVESHSVTSTCTGSERAQNEDRMNQGDMGGFHGGNGISGGREVGEVRWESQ
jgi:hypothetical protein